MTAKIEIIKMMPEFTNSVLITKDGLAVIFDPWGRGEDWLKLLDERGLKLHSIYCTHGHFDHISAVAGLPNVPWHLHPEDVNLLEWSNQILQQYDAPRIDTEKFPPQPISVGEIEILPDVHMNAIHCPGHSRGGMAFYFGNENTLLIGDTLFQDSIGRYDLPGANMQQLNESVTKIYNMNFPDDTIVIHGHGPETTIGWLKENNRFFNK